MSDPTLNDSAKEWYYLAQAFELAKGNGIVRDSVREFPYEAKRFICILVARIRELEAQKERRDRIEKAPRETVTRLAMIHTHIRAAGLCGSCEGSASHTIKQAEEALRPEEVKP
jgi:bacterioferritin-associated ferredoxin